MERNGVLNEVKMKRGKLQCDCLDEVFTGVPCRHMIMLANSQKEIKYESLPFNQRWKKDYYREPELPPNSPRDSLNLEERKEEAIENNVEETQTLSNFNQETIQVSFFHNIFVRIQNPDEVIGPGRPSTTNQRQKSTGELKFAAKRKGTSTLINSSLKKKKKT